MAVRCRTWSRRAVEHKKPLARLDSVAFRNKDFPNDSAFKMLDHLTISLDDDGAGRADADGERSQSRPGHEAAEPEQASAEAAPN